MSDRLRFGIFMAPFRRAGENPTKQRARDGRAPLAERNMQAVTDMVEKHAAELAATG